MTDAELDAELDRRGLIALPKPITEPADRRVLELATEPMPRRHRLTMRRAMNITHWLRTHNVDTETAYVRRLILHENGDLMIVTSEGPRTRPESSKHMTVKELIKALSEMPADWQVWTEGCDCWGHVGSVRPFDDGTYGSPGVLLARPANDD